MTAPRYVVQSHLPPNFSGCVAYRADSLRQAIAIARKLRYALIGLPGERYAVLTWSEEHGLLPTDDYALWPHLP